jgi:hypothetical protein
VGTLVIDQADEDVAAEVEAAGVNCVVAPTVMRTHEIAADLARTVLAACGTVTEPPGAAPGAPGS